MAEGNAKNRRQYGVIAACAVLALAVIAGAYQMGRHADPAGGNIGRDDAKAAALGHAGLAEGDLSHYEIALDESGGAPVYEVKFEADGCSYSYAVSADDGSIVGFRRETADAAPPAENRDAGTPAPADGDIGEAGAKESALDHAGVTADSVTGYKWEKDYDGGVPVYELEFLSGGYEYDYEINAADGTVIKFEKEPAADASGRTPAGNAASKPAGGSSTGGDIGEARAREIVLDHAGVTADSVTGYKWEKDYDGGVPVYELEFLSGGYEYDYEINAADGTVIKFEKEPAAGASGRTPAGSTASKPAGGSSTGGDIGEARAREIALDHAGVTADSITGYKWEKDYDDGVPVYELEFFSGGYEYDYEINAADGTVIKFEKEAVSGGVPSQGGQGISGGDIGEARAREIALDHAGVTADSITGYRWEKDYDDGVPVYELEFLSGGYEYDYEINAADGTVVKFEKEPTAYAISCTAQAGAGYIGKTGARKIAR